MNPITSGLRKKIAEFSRIDKGDKVLDVCCGDGNLILDFARFKAHGTGIDLNPNLIKEANRKAKKLDYNNLQFQVEDAANLPFRDGSFDYVNICLALHDKERELQKSIVSEMGRVTKPGRILIFTDYQTPLERNLMGYTIKIIELLSFKNHYSNFRDYHHNGGLQRLLEGHQIIEEMSLKKGNLISLKVRN